MAIGVRKLWAALVARRWAASRSGSGDMEDLPQVRKLFVPVGG
jgi:hypothetical protein